MLSKFWVPKVSIILAVLGLTACDDVGSSHNDQQAEYEANRLVRGNDAIADCIATQCRTLNIDGMKLEDYAVINTMTHVTVLMASRTTLADLSDIQALTHLEELHISYSPISDLSGLENFTKLRLLHAEGLPDALNITPVGSLTNLRELALGNIGEGDDVSFIRNMRKLENLILHWRGVDADLSVLRNHPALRNIDLSGALPAEQDDLLKIPNLDAINLNGAFPVDPNVAEELKSRGVYEEMDVMIVC